jgi:hypothetical protein
VNGTTDHLTGISAQTHQPVYWRGVGRNAYTGGRWHVFELADQHGVVTYHLVDDTHAMKLMYRADEVSLPAADCRVPWHEEVGPMPADPHTKPAR